MRDHGLSARPFSALQICGDRLRTLSARLLATHGATAILHARCEERGIGDGPVLPRWRAGNARRRRSDRVPDALRPHPAETVALHGVVLVRGAVAPPVAENWHVPERLTPAMCALLDDTDMPFVHVVGPRRRTTLVPHDHAGGGLEHHAVLTVADDRVIAVPQGRYRRALGACPGRRRQPPQRCRRPRVLPAPPKRRPA